MARQAPVLVTAWATVGSKPARRHIARTACPKCVNLSIYSSISRIGLGLSITLEFAGMRLSNGHNRLALPLV